MPKPDYTALDLPAAPADRPYIITNMVMSLDGKAVVEETEQGIGSKVDQRLMRELRVNADIVLTGAGTREVLAPYADVIIESVDDIRAAAGE